jgi:pimeloyl-ACP methyl ester carboxylesterase
MGGLLCMAYAARHRERLSSMVLIGSMPASDSEYTEASKAFKAALARAKAAGLVPDPEPTAVGNDCSAQLIARLPVYYHDPKHPAATNLAGSTCHADVGPLFWAELMWHGYDLRPQLASYDGPVLIVHGASDPFGRASFEAVVKAFPNATGGHAYLEKCGHIPWEECDEPFWAAVVGFLRKVDAGP